MEKNLLGSKIKDLRNGKGYSQEGLAELSQLSLRTVQRIENGETEARGDTLNRLAKALGVAVDFLTTPPPIVNELPVNYGYLTLMNLSGLACLVVAIPFLGIILPWVLWLIKKDTSAEVRESGKKILNFQITFGILTFLIYGLFIFHQFFHTTMLLPNIGGLGRPESTLIILTTFPLFGVLMVLINTTRTLMHKQVKYWPAIPFFR
jgi:transcriptional regulator with XRE-family HTH domain